MGAGIEWPKTWDGLVDLVKEMEEDPEAYLHRGELRQALEAVRDDDSLGVGEKKRAALERLAGLAVDGEKLRVTLELIDPEESERVQAAALKHANSRRALDRNRADQLAGVSKAAQKRAERDRGIDDFIDEKHARNAPKELILEELVDGWGAEAVGGPSALIDADYALSTDVLRKRESARRRARGKAPG